MSFGGFIITNNGRNELAQAQNSGTLSFSKVVLGFGKYSGSFSDISSLVNPVVELTIGKVSVDSSKCIVECDFSNDSIQEGFYLREIGIYANGILYCYDNAGDDAEYIYPAGSAVVKQKRLRFILNISSTTNVSLVAGSGLYTTYLEFEELQQSFNSRMSNCILEMPTKPTYSGLTVTVYAGTKVVIPNGRNTDGTMKNIIYTLSSDLTTANHAVNSIRTIFVTATPGAYSELTAQILYINKLSERPATVATSGLYRCFCEETNLWYVTSGSTTATWSGSTPLCVIASAVVGATATTSLTVRDTLKLAQQEDFLAMNVNIGSLAGLTTGIKTSIVKAINWLVEQLGLKAPTSHASAATTYGVGTEASYGHTKTINNLVTTAYKNGEALSAYQGKVLKDEVDTVNRDIVQSLPHYKSYYGTVNVTTSVTGGYFGQIALSACTGYDASITPHSILRMGCYANVNSAIQGNIERSGDNLNVYGPVSGTYNFSVLVMYF